MYKSRCQKYPRSGCRVRDQFEIVLVNRSYKSLPVPAPAQAHPVLVLLLKLYTTTISDSFSSNSGIFVHFIYSVGKCLPRINHCSGLQLLLTRWWPICIVMRDLFSMFISTSANFSAIPPVCTKIDLYLLIQEYHNRGLSEPQRNRYAV